MAFQWVVYWVYAKVVSTAAWTVVLMGGHLDATMVEQSVALKVGKWVDHLVD
jgi:hypothetical protein